MATVCHSSSPTYLLLPLVFAAMDVKALGFVLVHPPLDHKISRFHLSGAALCDVRVLVAGIERHAVFLQAEGQGEGEGSSG